MMKLKYNDKCFDLIGSYVVNKSSRQVTFSNLKIDFTNKTMDDLPCKYQECSLVKVNENHETLKTIFTGYINNITLPNMKNKDEFRELEIELLSPMALTTRRTITAIGEYKLKDLINEILQPLYNDGFVLKELNIDNSTITVNFLIETIESSLNKLSNKYNFWWYIDELKNIYINDINYQFSLEPKLECNEDKKMAGLIDLIPKLDATDYCNVVNITNVRCWLFSYDYVANTGMGHYIHATESPFVDLSLQISKDDQVDFYFPIDITIKNILKSVEGSFTYPEGFIFHSGQYPVLTFYGEDANNNSIGFEIELNNGVLRFSDNVGFEGTDNEYEFELIRDSFFNNLIVGFRYKGNNKITKITDIKSASALVWTRFKFNNIKEIKDAKNKISTSGQIEKIIDMNEQWKTINELQEIANSYININSSQSDQVNLVIDKDYSLKIGDIIKIDRPSFFIKNDYIITDIQEQYVSPKVTQYFVTLRNSNYLESYIDLFRNKETEEQESKIYNLITVDYNEDSIKETHEVV